MSTLCEVSGRDARDRRADVYRHGLGIGQYGYHRRDEELSDAEGALREE